MNSYFKISRFVNYLYYAFSSFTKKVYPCKLIGEKINNDQTIITFKILGKLKTYEIPIKVLFNCINLLENFSPMDALKLGAISFGDILFALPIQKRQVAFEEIKQQILTSSNFIYSHNLDENIENDSFDINQIKKYFNFKNKYTMRLVGIKNAHDLQKNIVRYTIFGKKEAYEIYIADLIKDKSMLMQFHPIEAIKLGFIEQGENVFFNT